VEPELAPSPDPKPVAPTPVKPTNGSSLSRPGKDAVSARATTSGNDLPMQANWNASLEPEVVRDNQLRSASFEQQSPKKGNPLRRALDGYCPVQLQENDRWVVGNQDFRLNYQGQVFVFSSDAARKRFEAAPEKYLPVQSGNDVVLAMEENRAVPGSVTHSAMWHGRVYLFSNSATLAAFQDDPVRYANATRQAPLQIPEDSL
jgi:YHS domain-containing protein